MKLHERTVEGDKVYDIFTYSVQMPCVFKKIEIGKNKETGRVSVMVFGPQSNELISSLETAGFPQHNLNYAASTYRTNDYITADAETEKLNKFLDIIFFHGGGQLPEEDRLSILSDIFPKKSLKEEIYTLLNKNKLTEALQKCREAEMGGFFDITWDMANRLYEVKIKQKTKEEKEDFLKESFDEVFKFYQSISSQSPYYGEANAMLARLMLLVKPDTESKEEQGIDDVSPGMKHLHQALRYALLAPIDSEIQGIIDMVFHSMCGKSGPPELKNIRGDADTLITLADYIYVLNEKVMELTKKSEMNAGKAAFSPSLFQKK